MGENGRDRVRERFTVETMVRRMADSTRNCSPRARQRETRIGTWMPVSKSLQDPGSLRRGRFHYLPVAPGRMEFAIEVRRAILESSLK